jgi:hypothetical protein
LSEHDSSTASDEAEVTEPGENMVPENVVSEPDESVPADGEPVGESGGRQPNPNRRRIRRPNQRPIQCRMQALRLGCSRRRYR